MYAVRESVVAPATSPALSTTLWSSVAAVVTAYALALALFFLLRSINRGRRIIGVVFGLLVLLCVLITPAEYIVLRAMFCLLLTDLGFKLIDYSRQIEQQPSMATGGLTEFCRFLVPFPSMIVVFRSWRRLRRCPVLQIAEIRRAAVGAALFIGCALLLKPLCRLPFVEASFTFDHVIKLVFFVVAIESLSQAICGFERACGFDTSPIVRFAFRSRTVGEFWQRYNTRVHDWLIANVFSASAQGGKTTRGIWLTFLISGIHHELGFGLATSRFDGYQFAFFTIQAPAAIATRRMNKSLAPFGIYGKILMHVMTILWFAVTSPLFFHGVNRVFPIYCTKTL